MSCGGMSSQSSTQRAYTFVLRHKFWNWVPQWSRLIMPTLFKWSRGSTDFFSSFRYTFMNYFLYKIGLCFAFFHLKGCFVFTNIFNSYFILIVSKFVHKLSIQLIYKSGLSWIPMWSVKLLNIHMNRNLVRFTTWFSYFRFRKSWKTLLPHPVVPLIYGTRGCV